MFEILGHLPYQVNSFPFSQEDIHCGNSLEASHDNVNSYYKHLMKTCSGYSLEVSHCTVSCFHEEMRKIILFD